MRILYHKTGVSAREKAASVIDPDAGMWYNTDKVYALPGVRQTKMRAGMNR